MATLKTPAEKIPLVTRKNFRDEWTNKSTDYETKIAGILGEKWSIQVNPNVIYPYADETYASRLGTVVTWYMDAVVSNLSTFATKYGTDGVSELNTLCTNHTLSFEPQNSTTNFTYGGLIIQSGTLRLVFALDAFAVNVDDVSSKIAEALVASSVPPNGRAYNLLARQAVRIDYDPSIDRVVKELQTAVAMPNLQLKPNFETNATALAAFAIHDPAEGTGWESNFGRATLDYFESLKYYMDEQKFQGDDMLQEAFQEAVEFGIVGVRIVEKLNSGKDKGNEVVVDEGCLWLQTTANFWYHNVMNVADELMDIL